MSTLDVIVYITIFVAACTGALKARAFHMDIFGGLVMALVMSFGGGSIREILMGNKVKWLNDYAAFILVGSAVVITFIFKRRIIKYRKIIFFTDAVTLGLFTVVGIESGFDNGLAKPFAIMMGVITATFGGLIADIISNTVPTLLKKGEMYATASAIGGAIYVLNPYFGMDKNTNMIICVVLIVFIRILSKWKKLMLPEI
jgi:uncharacterized membrane protein YeiH